VLRERIELPSTVCNTVALPLDERSIILVKGRSHCCLRPSRGSVASADLPSCWLRWKDSNLLSRAYETDSSPESPRYGAAEGNRTLLHLLDRERLSQRATTACMERVGRVELRIIGLEDRWAPLATIYPH